MADLAYGQDLAHPRVRMRGGGLYRFALDAGDVVRVTDVEGGQPAELFVLGNRDPATLFSRPADEAGASATQRLASLLATAPEGRSSSAVPAEPVTAAGAYRLSGPDAAPGETIAFTASTAMECLIAVPVLPAMPDALVPTTDIDIAIERAVPQSPAPPPPLAAPRLDFRIDRATAEAYTVKAGEYIQIIDIEGRQCSDFIAFDQALLNEGVECGLDATATRTLVGRLYPGPGLYSKFFDAKMRAMVEVVRDTCGRHDTFAYACTAKYYEDKGYPGHANCSDNFNQVLEPYGVPSRPGWPAINFFYNTILSADGGIGLDEPWSRPGDYVLLRALTDLVCASSSCSDDVDPANGWVPTDIQIRVYPKENDFSRAIVHRMTPDSPPILTRETGFHARIAPLSRRMVEYRNFWLPQSFQGYEPIDEYWACREKAAVMDLSPLRKFEVVGPDAEALLDYAVTRDIRKLAVGQVVYTAVCHPHGGMMDDATIFRIDAHNFRFVCGDEYCGTWLRKLAAEKGLKASVRGSTDQLNNIAVQGPLSREILQKIIWTAPSKPSVADLKWFRFAVGRLFGPEGPALILSRTGYTGELGFELWCHPKDAPAVWDAVWQAGEPLGLAPLGLEALDMLRIEAGLIFAGYDFCDETDPFEAGIGFTVPLSTKPGDFVGREALTRRQAAPQRKLVGLEIEGQEPAHHGDPVFVGRAKMGVVTSGIRSPVLSKTIALARVDIAYAEDGTELEIGKLDGHQKRLKAKVVRFPHYDPEKTRVRA